jgi:hypothetical protein
MACSNMVGPDQSCSIAGSGAGVNSVTGTTYMEAAFTYKKDHIWRNVCKPQRLTNLAKHS